MKTSVLLLCGILEKADSGTKLVPLKKLRPKSINHLDQSMLTAPDCDDLGLFKSIQCSEHHCCCVDKHSGQPIKHTTTSKSQRSNLYCNYSFPPTCTAYTFNCTKCQKTYSGKFKCTESDCHTLSPPLCLQYEILEPKQIPVARVKKEGKCPPVSTNIFSWYSRFSCIKKCHSDADCGGETKCCFNGCSSECKQPVMENETCCSAPHGFRQRCNFYSQSTCTQGGCCWDGSRRQCFKSSCSSSSPIRTLKPHQTANWYLWSGWSDCACDQKLQTAFRACRDGRPGQGSCIGPSTRTKECDKTEIKTKCGSQWSTWSEWSEPTVTCGSGMVTRNRKCPDGQYCHGENTEAKLAATERDCPSWSQWSLWKDCSASCGLGTTTRARICQNQENEGDCGDGDFIEVKDCQSDLQCPSWREWSPWETCSETCGLGTSSRTRTCTTDGDESSPPCPEGKRSETKVCFLGKCPEWQPWAEWSACSQTCGHGIKARGRNCSIEHACTGDHFETDECQVEPCPKWSSWSEWSDCSEKAYCKSGQSTRQRACIIGKCEGPQTEVKNCATPCGKLTEWSEWTDCSSLCDGGEQHRARFCIENNLVQSAELCLGKQLGEQRSCGTESCSLWTPWTEWSLHSKEWKLIRNRKCLNMGQLSNACKGPHSEEKFCTKTLCPFFGEWTEWEETGDNLSRDRECLNGNLGQPGCIGESTESKACESSCLQYGPWSMWKLTVNEIFERSRECLDTGTIASLNNPCGESLSQVEEKTCDQNCASWSEWQEWGDVGDRQRRRLRSCRGGTVGDPGCTGPESEAEETTPWTRWIFNQPKFELERSRNVCPDSGCRFPRRQRQTKDCSVFDQCPTWSEWEPWKATLAGPFQRTRSCSRSKDLQFIHLDCSGPSTHEVNCEIEKCGTWTPWSPWELERTSSKLQKVITLDDTDYVGDIYDYQPLESGTESVEEVPVYHYTRRRQCENGTIGMPNCLGESVQEDVCLHGCPYWSTWSPWLSTGTVIRRTRECIDESVQFSCEGPDEENIKCDAINKCPVWTEWQDWSKVNCEDDCYRSRARECTESNMPNFDTANCLGDAIEKQFCRDKIECPLWGQWLSEITNLNHIVRSRACKANSNFECYEGDSEVVCDSDCPYWSEWTEWASVDNVFTFDQLEPVQTDTEKEKRSRFCIKSQSIRELPNADQLIQRFCPGHSEETRNESCEGADCDKFGPWQEIDKNSTHTSYIRECLGNLDRLNRGLNGCEGELLKTEPNVNCNKKHGCPYWSQWTEWSDIAPIDVLHQRGHITRDNIFEGSAIDDELLEILTFTEDEAETLLESTTADSEYRKRDCVNLVLQPMSKIVESKETYCPGEDIELRESPGKFADWTEWQFEPETNLMRRSRRCQSDLGMNCPDLTEDRACSPEAGEKCAQWTDWTETKRNDTHVTYARVCIDNSGTPVPNTPDLCPGEREKVEALAPRQQRRLTSTISCMERCAKFGPWSTFKPDESNTQMVRKRVCLNNYECEVIDTVACKSNVCIYFSEWSSWALVQASRIDERHRTCINGQVNQHPHCQGKLVERRINIEPFWSEWTPATKDCSSTCGIGVRVHTRFCSIRDKCQGTESIKLETCKVDKVCPEWVAWEPWTSCSTTCGGGTRERIRECPMGGCEGEALEVEPCNKDKACPSWSLWSDPTPCSKSCGDGIRLQTRHCLNASNQHCAKVFNSTTFIREEACNTQKCPIWSEWSYYSECSSTCGNGTKNRKRHCLYGDSCEGESEQTTFCSNELCPYLSDWTLWSTCTVTCGQGLKVRHRKCVNGENCEGDLTEAKGCTENDGNCPRPGPWSEWGDCSSRCDGGIQSRQRKCVYGLPGELGCIAAFDETRVCNQRPCPFYTAWQSSECSASCGGGFEAQSRSCANLAKGLEDYCTEETTRLVACNEHACPAWSEWGEYGPCTRTCGVGKKNRKRTCQNGFVGQKGCNVGSSVDEATCNTDACPLWIDWSEWTECSSTCAPQQSKQLPLQRRERGCIFGEIGQVGCEGEPQEIRECNTDICPHWTDWKVTMQCSATCGGGVELKTRQCVNGVPGVTEECSGPAFINEKCNLQPCPYWAEWQNVDECSASCGGGTVSRKRECQNGIANQSPECNGDVADTTTCNEHSCASWSTWSEWTKCSAQCDTGTKSRYRECFHGNTGDNGCEGEAVELISCSDALCKQWTEWSDWSACSVTCQRGVRDRKRECVGQIGSCEGESSEISDCYEGECPKWSDWRVASECPVTCGGGLQKMERECFNGEVGQVGCTGSNEKVVDCNKDLCPEWNDWAEWSDCTATCGGGTRFTRRKCINGNKGQDGCKGDDLRFEPCANEPCVYWTQWGEWGECEAICADVKCRTPEACSLADKREKHYRYRNCINGQVNGVGCAGEREESKKCTNLPECDQWANWGPWGDCSQTCRPVSGQAGSRSRSRGCDSLIREALDERLCPGAKTETQVCASYPCTSQLVFDAVKEAICEPKYEGQTCGTGFMRAQRQCTSEEVEEGECDSTGQMIVVQDCDLGSCKTWRARQSTYVPDADWGFTTNFKNNFRNELGPNISLKSSIVCSRADVVLLLDSSSSMGTEKTKLSVEFAKKLTKRFKIGLDKYRVAIAKYDKDQELLMSLRDSVSNLDVLKKLDTITYDDGRGTLTGKALEFVAKNVLNKFGYQGDRISVPDVIVLVTDGKSFDNPESISMRLHDRHIKIIVIGIGPGAYEPQLHRIASVPVEENTFKFNSYDELAKDKNIRTIAAQVKQQCYMAKGWSKWGEWESCSTSCGQGEKMRRRRCHHATEGSRGCPGSWKDVEICNTEPSKQCNFVADGQKLKNSSTMASGKWINGEWSEWTTEIVNLKSAIPVYLSECSAPCGGGTRKRQAPNKDASPISEICNTQPCARQWSIWSIWSSWSVCSVTCGSGSQFRKRDCDVNSTLVDDGVDCAGKPEEIRVCQKGGCPYYTEWQPWSPCAATCGQHTQRTRVRGCKNSFNGPCVGPAFENENCNLSPCPNWAEWIEWSSIECSAACGAGSKTRERECINGEPHIDCLGIRKQITDCTNGPCQTWSPWSRETSECSVTCGIGTKTRSRSCQRGICPEENCCKGDSIKYLPCRGPPCHAKTTTTPLLTTTAPVELLFTNTSDCQLTDENVRLQCLNSECEIMCKPGYELVGAKFMNCAAGQWNQTQPQCARQCSDDVDIVLAIPADITDEGALYVRTLIRKVIILFGDSKAKFSAVFINGQKVYWAWQFEDYISLDHLIELTDSIRPESINGSNEVPSDLVQFLFNMSGRNSPNILVDFTNKSGAATFANQDEAFYTSKVDINDLIEKTQGESDDGLVYQLADDMKFCTKVFKKSMECLDQSQVDLSFVIDSSSSIGADNYKAMKDFVIKIIQSFTVGPSNVQVALLRYNSDIEPVYWLDTFNTRDEIVTATADMEYSGSGTSTGAALEYAAVHLLNPDFGARQEATKMTIVLTDGGSDDYIDQSAQLLRSRSNVIAIGVTKDSNKEELSRIASPPLSRSIYQVSDFNDLDLVTDSILDALCTVKTIEQLN